MIEKKVFALLALISVVTPLTLFGINAADTSSTKIYVNPPTMIAPPSEDFVIDIEVENVTDLFGWQAKLKWDPWLLSYQNATEGDFLKTGGNTGWNIETRNATEGWILGFSFITGSVSASVSGSGTLGRFAFRGTSIGECTLELSNTKTFSQPDLVPTPPYLGDANGDMRVDVKDLFTVAKAFLKSVGDPGYNPNADFNSDGTLDLFDLLCAGLNNGHKYPDDVYAWKPVVTTHEVHDGYVTIYSPANFPVTWKWLDYYENQVWLTANVTVSSSGSINNFDFNRSLEQISFNLTSATPGSCNVSVPKLLMDGAFKVLINDTLVASTLTWNKTHTFIYFTHEQGTHSVAIIGEIVTRIRAPDLLTMVDINGDGEVNILDITAIAVRNGWKEDP